MPPHPSLPLDQIIQGDCVEILASLPEKSVDVIFADPPYNLQLQNELWRPNMTKVAAVDDDWDRFTGFAEYDLFTRDWLSACRRVLKDAGAIWVIGSYHNIFRLGAIMQDLGFWLLNDIAWIKTNPMPNFRGVRFTNAHETLIWAAKSKKARYTFNHHAMKALNEDLQMRSDWLLPICSGPERLRINGKKAHSTQKPEALLYRVLLATSNPGDVVLDPFFGSGTTGVVAQRLGRHWIGLERQPEYVEIAQQRMTEAQSAPVDPAALQVSDLRKRQPRLPFGSLLEQGLLRPGDQLFFRGDRSLTALLLADGRLRLADGFEGSIHQAARHLTDGAPCNGWIEWLYQDAAGELRAVDELRRIVRERGGPGG